MHIYELRRLMGPYTQRTHTKSRIHTTHSVRRMQSRLDANLHKAATMNMHSQMRPSSLFLDQR